MNKIVNLYDSYEAPGFMLKPSNTDETNLSETQKDLVSQILKEFKQTLFSIKDAAEILDISEEFLRRSVNSGLIFPTKFGDRIMINIYQLSSIILNGVKYGNS